MNIGGSRPAPETAPVWHADAGRGGVRSLAYSPDDRTLYAVTGAGRVRAWDLGTHDGRELFRLLTSRGVGAGVLVRPGGADVLVHAVDDALNPFWTWDVARGRLVYPGNRPVDPAGEYLLLEPPDDEPGDGDAVLAAAFSADGSVMYARTDGRVARHGYSVDTPRPNREFARLTRDAVHLAGTPDGRRVAVSTARGTVVVWDTAADALVTQVKLPFGTLPAAIAVSSRGVLAVSLQDELRFFDADTGTPAAAPFVARPATLIALSPASDVALTADGTGGVTVWRSGSPLGRYDWQVGKVRALVIAPDGLTAAVGGTARQFAVVDLDV